MPEVDGVDPSVTKVGTPMKLVVSARPGVRSRSDERQRVRRGENADLCNVEGAGHGLNMRNDVDGVCAVAAADKVDAVQPGRHGGRKLPGPWHSRERRTDCSYLVAAKGSRLSNSPVSPLNRNIARRRDNAAAHDLVANVLDDGLDGAGNDVPRHVVPTGLSGGRLRRNDKKRADRKQAFEKSGKKHSGPQNVSN